jgi:hypothetical protein
MSDEGMLDVMMPNGKTLAECTFADRAAFAEQMKQIEKKIGDSKIGDLPFGTLTYKEIRLLIATAEIEHRLEQGDTSE